MASVTVDNPKLINHIWLDGYQGICIRDTVLDNGASLEELRTAIESLRTLQEHPFMAFGADWTNHFNGGADFPWAGKGYTIQEFYDEVIKPWENKEAARKYRRGLISQRRSAFARQRPELLLALIHRDGPRCKHPGCQRVDDMTVDHLVPLSLGGTDDLDNLQLLCRVHNSLKGARVDQPATETA